MGSIWDAILNFFFRNRKFKENFEEFNNQKEVINDFIKEYKDNILDVGIINDEKKNEIIKLNKNRFELCSVLIKSEDKLSEEDISMINSFIDTYSNFDKIIKENNNKQKALLDFKTNKKAILKFIEKYKPNESPEEYLTDFKIILSENKSTFNLCNDINNLFNNDFEFQEIITEFLDIYNNFEKVSKKNNQNYLNNLYGIYKENKPEISNLLKKYDSLDCKTYLKDKDSFLDNFTNIYEISLQLIDYHKKTDFEIEDYDFKLMNDFFLLFDEFNSNFPKKYYEKFIKIKVNLEEFIDEFTNKTCNGYIFDKKPILDNYSSDIVIAEDILMLNQHDEIKLKNSELNCVNSVIDIYNDFDDIIDKNNNCYVKKLLDKYYDNENTFLNFINTYTKNSILDYFVDDVEKKRILESHIKCYELALEIKSIPEINSIDTLNQFFDTYDNFDEIIPQMNKNYLTKLYNDNEKIIKKYIDIVNGTQEFYVSNSIINELIEKYDFILSIVEELINRHGEGYVCRHIELLKEFPELKKVLNNREFANEEYISRELSTNKIYFDEMFKNQNIILDQQQRRAVVIDEDTTQIIAGAGTGKTLTLQAKIKYLIEKKGFDCEDIVAISYSNASVKDLKERIPENIEIKTIHSLANHILQENGEEHDTEAHALDNVIENYFLDNIIDDKVKLENLINYYSFYQSPFVEYEGITSKGELYEKESGIVLEPLKNKYSQDFKTFKRDYVRSFEELMIANFLFINGIDYVYEPRYKVKSDEYYAVYDLLNFNNNFKSECPKKLLHQLTKNIVLDLGINEHKEIEETKKRRYRPDFYLPDYDIYLEHFGVNREGKAIWLEDPKEIQKYSDSMEWKRKLHSKYNTKLLETYSYYRSENKLLDKLEQILKNEGVFFNKLSPEEIYEKLIENDKLDYFAGLILLIKSFISIFKGNAYDYSYLDQIWLEIEKNEFEFNKIREQLLFNIIKDIFDIYNDYLGDELIDFDDMINDACESIKQKGVPEKYKYILVDEYQDVSYMRYHFLKTIQDKINSKIIVIGDDWQSIYKFSGCDVNLFKNLKDYFEKPASVKIESTYRNSQQLIDISGNFVMKNDFQIKKELKSDKSNLNPIKIAYYNIDFVEVLAFEELIKQIIYSDDYDGSEILVLGRNQKDIERLVKGNHYNNEIFTYYGDVDYLFEKNKYVQLIYLENRDINIKYRTIHGSKGLQAKYVIVINLKDKVNGIPNKMKDDPILRFVIWTNDEDYNYAEERRLFYVALTRTKDNCYLLAPQAKKSIFVDELEQFGKYIGHLHFDFAEKIDEIEIPPSGYIPITTNLKCPECKTGNVKLLWHEDEDKRFFGCSHMRCEWVGGNYKGKLEDLKYLFNCPDCDGVVVKREGAFGKFFSCNDYSCGFTCDDFTESNYQTSEIDLQCKECGSKLLAAYDENSNRGGFICSNEKCNYYGGRFFMHPEKLEIHGYCPECSGILFTKTGRNGEFIGCSNFRKNGGCRYTSNLK